MKTIVKVGYTAFKVLGAIVWLGALGNTICDKQEEK